MSFPIPPAAAGTGASANLSEKKENERVTRAEEVENYELSDEEAAIGKAKRSLFEAGISRRELQITQPAMPKEEMPEQAVPDAIVVKALDLGDLFCEQLSQIEATQLQDFLKNWAEFAPEQKNSTLELLQYFQTNPDKADDFLADVVDYLQGEEGNAVAEHSPERSPQRPFQANIRTDWGAIVAAILLEKLPPLNLEHAFTAFLQMDTAPVVTKKDFVVAEMQLLHKVLTSLFLLQHFEQIQSLLKAKQNSHRATPFIDYLNQQLIEKSIYTLHSDLQKKISSCMTAYFQYASALDDVLQLLDTIEQASLAQREELSNYLCLQDDIGNCETDCLLWNELVAAKKSLPDNLVKILIEKVQILTSQPK